MPNSPNNKCLTGRPPRTPFESYRPAHMPRAVPIVAMLAIGSGLAFAGPDAPPPIQGAATTSAAAAGSSADPPRSAREELRFARTLSHAFREVARELAPSVVSVTTIDRSSMPGLPPGQRAPDRRGQGSGVIITHDGFIVTNFHVVRGASEIIIRLMDRRELQASVVGVDPDTDLAVLKVDSSGLVPARFGDSEAIEPGEWGLALGNPFGLEQTLTAGIISAKGRSGMGLATYENFLQTDAAINPGNSGGPLVDLDGRVVGINTAISSTDGGNHGVGFAIPATMVERVAAELIDRGHVQRGWLGVGVAPAVQGNRALRGALLSHVAPNTPAWNAGLRAGDLILKLDDFEVENPTEFIREIGERQPRSEIVVTALRQGTTVQTRAVLGERPTPARRDASEGPEPAEAPGAATPGPGVREPASGQAPSDGERSVRKRERAAPIK